MSKIKHKKQKRKEKQRPSVRFAWQHKQTLKNKIENKKKGRKERETDLNNCLGFLRRKTKTHRNPRNWG